MKRFFCALFLVLGLASRGSAQPGPPVPTATTIPVFTVATLPAASSMTGRTVMVWDGATGGTCTAGGGGYRNLCQSNGASWITLSGGGSVPEGRTLTATAPLTGGGDLTANRAFACPTCEITTRKGAANGYAGLDVGGVVLSSQGGTGNAFTKFTGPTTIEKTFTLPDASGTLGYFSGTPGTGFVTKSDATGALTADPQGTGYAQERRGSGYASLNALVAAHNAQTPSVLPERALIENTLTLSADVTVPTTLTLATRGNGRINCNGHILTINGAIENSLYVPLFTNCPAGSLSIPTTTKTGTFSIVWWEAVNDDSTDNTTALQAALSDTPEGATLYVPYGIYRTGNLTVQKMLNIVGENFYLSHRSAFGNSNWTNPAATKGSLLRCTATTGVCLTAAKTGTSQLSLSMFNVGLIGPGSGTSDGLQLAGTVGSNTGSINGRLYNVLFANFGGIGLHVKYAEDYGFFGVRASGNATGIKLDEAGTNQNSFYNTELQNDTVGVLGTAGALNMFYGGLCQTSADDCFRLTGATAWLIDGFWFEAQTAGSAIEVSGTSQRNKITNNYFSSNAGTVDISAGVLHSLVNNSFLRGAVRPKVFSGTGLDNLISGGTYTGGTTAATFAVTIDATGTPDTFSWTKDGGGGAAGVAITGAAQTLSDGVTVTFATTTGHTIADSWSISVVPFVATLYAGCDRCEARGNRTEADTHISSPTTVAQVIGSNGFLNADACGGIKRITSAGNVTTGSSFTFDGLGTAYTGCDMVIRNEGSFTITLRASATSTPLATLSGGNIVLGPGDSVRMWTSGLSLAAGGYWYQISAVTKGNGSSVLATGANGQLTSATTNRASSGTIPNAATYTFTGLIPAGVEGQGVTCRVTTAVTGAAKFDVGVGGATDRFCKGVAAALNTTCNLGTNPGTSTGPLDYHTATDVVLTGYAVDGTTPANFTGGVVECVAHYLTLDAPTS